MGSKKTITLTIDDDVAEFIKRHGHHHRTDFAAGRVNVSSEVNDFLRRFMGRMTPEVIGYQLAHRKEDLKLQMEDVDKQAQEILGYSTIDEWLVEQIKGERKEADLIERKVQIREKVKTEIWTRIENDYGKMRRGQGFSRKADQSWLVRFKRELRTLGLSRAEALRVLRGEDRSPEVR